MLQGRSLRSRLLVGLLAVTGTGLLVTCLVSFLTLRAFIAERLDAQLEFAADRAMARLDAGTPPVGVDAPSPSPYFVVLLDLRTGEVNQLFGDTEREDVVLERIDQLTREDLLALGTSQEIFELDGVTGRVPPHRATVRLRVDAFVVTGVPTDDLQDFPRQLVWTQLLTAGVLLGGLVLAGRWLITRGLAPLDRMATTANRISTGSDLADRMPDAEPYSEVGRLGMAINTMLARIEETFQAQRASEERVRTFAADASHELRTPLTTIRGYAELYRQGVVPPEELPDAIGRIEQEAERMSRLVAELLELARLDRGNSLLLAPSDLSAVVRDMASDARAVEPDRPVTVDIPEELIWRVDETRFRQILANLLSNVREHTPPEAAVTIRLSTGTAEDGTRSVRMDVADRGPGMATEDMDRAFDRFYRGSREPGGGSGLGLAIVSAIVAAHDGEVRIDSAPGRGTTVSVVLPERPASEP